MVQGLESHCSGLGGRWTCSGTEMQRAPRAVRRTAATRIAPSTHHISWTIHITLIVVRPVLDAIHADA